MAKAVNLSLRTVQRIWRAHKLQPHRWRTFKRSKDPALAEKVFPDNWVLSNYKINNLAETSGSPAV
jgi:hypothetical protein